MNFRILGLIEAVEGEGPLALGGAKQRALLGMLLLHVNEVVSTDRLIEELWPGERREDAVGALQVAISRLRKALAGDSRLLVTRPPGYELRVAPTSSMRSGSRCCWTRAGGRWLRATRSRRVPTLRRRCSCGAARHSPTSPTRPSARPRSPASRRCAWPRSKGGLRPIWSSAATASWWASCVRSCGRQVERLLSQALATYRELAMRSYAAGATALTPGA